MNPESDEPRVRWTRVSWTQSQMNPESDEPESVEPRVRWTQSQMSPESDEQLYSDIPDSFLYLSSGRLRTIGIGHRRRIYTIEKAKVVVSVWGDPIDLILCCTRYLPPGWYWRKEWKDALKKWMIIRFVPYQTTIPAKMDVFPKTLVHSSLLLNG